jgi:rhodanese-related sulfurtransferase
VEIKEISRGELKGKLDRNDNFKLIMALGEWAFRAKRIPGSIHYPSVEEALGALDPGDEIVVYCSNASCMASVAAYRTLVDSGYTNVRRYAGGLLDWEEAGYPLEGEWIA